MTCSSSFEVLSFCSNLTDLRIVGSNCPFRQLFMTLTKKCRLIEHLCLGTYFPLVGTMDASTVSHLIELVTNSPNLTSLTLIGFQLTNEMARNLVESSQKLKYLNLSRSPKINGHFLRCKYKMLSLVSSKSHYQIFTLLENIGRDLGNSCKESPLETLIMRNCVKLEEVNVFELLHQVLLDRSLHSLTLMFQKEVLELCNSLLKGNFKFIRHIDVSSNNGLVSDDGQRSYKPKFPVEKLKEERPDVTLVADFPLERSSPSITILDFYSNLIRELKCRSVKRYHVGVEGDDEELREIEMMDAKNDEEENDDSFDDDDDDDDV
ncbi:hypothetical protein YC2023_037779 [Brassica napus]